MMSRPLVNCYVDDVLISCWIWLFWFDDLVPAGDKMQNKMSRLGPWLGLRCNFSARCSALYICLTGRNRWHTYSCPAKPCVVAGQSGVAGMAGIFLRNTLLCSQNEVGGVKHSGLATSRVVKFDWYMQFCWHHPGGSLGIAKSSCVTLVCFLLLRKWWNFPALQRAHLFFFPSDLRQGCVAAHLSTGSKVNWDRDVLAGSLLRSVGPVASY